jgi:4'-phosphopantetheinyl transferase
MTATIPPPLMAWSKHVKNRCEPVQIPVYWKTHDVLTFLADTGMYDTSMHRGLDSAEKERVLQFKSEYFKKRFIVSRSLIKCILRYIPGTGNRDEIVLSRKNKGILVVGWQDLFCSLSYSGSCIALSVAKRKVGIDIEGVRPVDIRKIRSSPLFDDSKCRNIKEVSRHALHVWTLMEAYAKLRDTNPFPLLTSPRFFHDAGFKSYCIDEQAILSLAWDYGLIKDTLLWIDPETFSLTGKNTPCSSSLYGGDTYVRS